MLAATGRKADVQGLGLEELGVALSKNGKVGTSITAHGGVSSRYGGKR